MLMLGWLCCRKSGAKVNMPQQESTLMTKLMSKYFLALQKAQFDDAYIMSKSLAVMHMMEPSDTLYKPDVAGRILWHVMKHKLKLQSDHQQQPAVTN